MATLVAAVAVTAVRIPVAVVVKAGISFRVQFGSRDNATAIAIATATTSPRHQGVGTPP
jgi:hypothetical protein